ncbi:MAG: AMP-binding protein [Proteobacteria bacterium]|nr:AMP-binding protein [Pseudomonadota bacterium]
MNPLERARSQPNALAFDDGTRPRPCQELVDRAWRIASLLRDELGVAPGEHVAMLMGNRVEFAELALGSLLAGVWIAPINWHFNPEEVAYVAADCRARALFCDPAFAATAAEGEIDCPRIEAGEQLDRILAGASDAPRSLEGPAGGIMLYTSGTTGRPKGVKRPGSLSIAESFEQTAQGARVMQLDGGGPNLVTGPLYHGSPYGFASMDMSLGASVIVMPQFDAAEMLRIIQEREVRATHLVPVMMVRALNLPEEMRASFDPGSLRTVLHGAAPVSVAVKRRMIDWWGPLLVEYWGSSEGGGYCVVDSQEWLAHPGTVGRPVESYEVFAVDENLEPLPPGEVGVLYCRHKLTTEVFEYFNQPDKTSEVHLVPGTFTNGDVGRVDPDGYVYLTDRAADMINSGGVNIYPAEIESILLELPAVADAAVFGIPDDEWGESVKAAVELVPGATPDPDLPGRILDWARERMAGYKVPRSIDLLDELPRSPNGKLYKRRLRDPYWAGRERRI